MNKSISKCIYGGKYSNHQKSRILSESSLIGVYKDTRAQFEEMFCLTHTTTHHSLPKMTMTFNKLGEYMRKESTNEHVNGRDAFSVPNAMAHTSQ